ncbi:MAG: penicillin-binding protein 2 [Phycisphaerales bacterium]|jgi:cell division protein FtsI/penicillin-binding protein 2|nr:penicillin-binding protein 2 [Phycisphaerales bacterium]
MTAAEPARAKQSRRIASWSTIMAVAATAALLVIPIRVIQLQVAPPPQLSKAGVHDGRSVPLVRRGDLLDRRGRVLATTTRGWRLFLDPGIADDPTRLGTRLHEQLGIPAVDIDRLLSGRLHRRYIPVPGLLEQWQVRRLRAEPIKGVAIEPRSVREYPTGTTAGSLVGLVGFEHVGLSGLEHGLDRRLGPGEGSLRVVRDASRRTLWVPAGGFDPGRNGDTVHLSIDLEIQRLAEDRLAQAVAEFGAAGGRLVAMDPATGEILAAADCTEQPEPTRLQRHRCVTDPYEPGSTFKPFIWAAATQDGTADPDEVLATPTSGPHRTSFGRRIRDAHPKGPTSWRGVLVKSLNSGMAIVAERMRHQRMQAVVAALGFGRATACGIPGETRGIVTSEQAWSDYTQTSVAMGHEIAVTPVQMARAFCVFAGDGSMPAATIHRAHASDDLMRTPVFDEDTARLTRETMQLVMSEGTGRRANSTMYSMFGKSGTAQLPIAEGGGYHEDRYVSSFIAGAPAHAPRIVVLCVIDDPDRSLGAWYGGSTAGPVVRDVIDGALPYLGVAADNASVASGR